MTAPAKAAPMREDELRDFASLMVDEVIAKTRLQLQSGVGLSVADQIHLLDQLIVERARLAHTARPDAHSDDVAVDLFAAKMKAKLAAARAKGRNGWDDPTLCAADYLRTLLNEHVGKGDPVDVANFCMMLSHRDESTARPDAGDEDVRYKSALNQIADLGSCASGKRPAHKLLQDAIDIAIGAL